MTISVTYRSIDRVRIARKFKSLAGARRFAVEYVGDHPSIGCGYAVSDDGVGKVTVSGATLRELFFGTDAAKLAREAAEAAASDPYDAGFDDYQPYRISRTKGCTCCDETLYRIGCECLAEWPF